MEIAPGTSADKLVQDRDVDADSTFFENATLTIFFATFATKFRDLL